MKILIVGCGYLGSALAGHFVGQGHEVWGLRRNPDAHSKFHPIAADLLDRGALKRLPLADTVILCQAPKRGEDNYRGTYYDGTRNILNVIPATGPAGRHESPRVIFISSTGVYGARDGSWVDETTDPRSQGYGSKKEEEQASILLETEKLILASGLPATVFRLGGIYGPGRHHLQMLRDTSVGATRRVAPTFSNAYVNRIRLEDIVAGVGLLLQKGEPGQIYLGADDEPVTQNEFYSWLAGKIKLDKPPAGIQEPFSGKRCSNKKIKELGMRFKYPTFREGYADLLDAE